MANKKKEEISSVIGETKILSPIKPKKPKSKKQICIILYKKDKKFAIDFNGRGISIKDSSLAKTNKVEVTYVGEIGNKNFKIKSHKFI